MDKVLLALQGIIITLSIVRLITSEFDSDVISIMALSGTIALYAYSEAHE